MRKATQRRASARSWFALGAVRAERLFVALMGGGLLSLPLAVWRGGCRLWWRPPRRCRLHCALWRIWRVRQGDCRDPLRWEARRFLVGRAAGATAVAELIAFVVLGAA